MNENEVIKKHLADLARRADERGYPVFSDFLNLNDISLLKQLSLPCPVTLFGGYAGAERCVARFGEEADYPIVCLRVQPAAEKFADRLTHRDCLGALMHLGINRNTLGDILIRENTAYLFCLENMATYICENLTKIRHTTVRCKQTDGAPDVVTALPEETLLTVSSLRTNAVIGAVYKLSRSAAARLFAQDRVFINAAAVHKESTMLKEKDTVSVHGYGRFIFEGIERKTKKDREVISVRIYK